MSDEVAQSAKEISEKLSSTEKDFLLACTIHTLYRNRNTWKIFGGRVFKLQTFKKLQQKKLVTLSTHNHPKPTELGNRVRMLLTKSNVGWL